MKFFAVYILFNQSRSLYVGVTSDLLYRLSQHRLKMFQGFASRYGISMLAYYEFHDSAHAAFARETQIKGWTRKKKIALVETMNPEWEDLTDSLRDKPRTNPTADDSGQSKSF